LPILSPQKYNPSWDLRGLIPNANRIMASKSKEFRGGRKFMAAINVDKMPLKDLQDLEVRVKKAIVIARERERNEVRQAMMALAANRGLSLNEVFGTTRAMKSGGKVAVKYRNPNNPEETWAGRGRQPKWLVAALKKGANVDDFAV
jgi:DNA-binding protein H-NS